MNVTGEAVGDDYTIGVRMLGEEFTKEGNTLLQSARVARRLASRSRLYQRLRWRDLRMPIPLSRIFPHSRAPVTAVTG